jgi:hypothetical protein
VYMGLPRMMVYWCCLLPDPGRTQASPGDVMSLGDRRLSGEEHAWGRIFEGSGVVGPPLPPLHLHLPLSLRDLNSQFIWTVTMSLFIRMILTYFFGSVTTN